MVAGYVSLLAKKATNLAQLAMVWSLHVYSLFTLITGAGAIRQRTFAASVSVAVAPVAPPVSSLS